MQFVSRGYWDPEESTREKWTNTYASELQERGLSQDFTGLSELLLGQAQPAQFQSSDQTGYWWGSKVSDDGNFTMLDKITANANAAMPRSYCFELGCYYQYYSAHVESAGSDSLCPHGWTIPRLYRSSGYSGAIWNELFVSYGVTTPGANNQDGYAIFMKAPLSMYRYGFYGDDGGGIGNTTVANLHTGASNEQIYFMADYYVGQGGRLATHGAYIRCVQK